MTENEKRWNGLIDTLIDLVSTIEYSDIVSYERFLEFDNAGAEIIDCIEELKEYRAIGTIEEFKALKENSFFNFDSPVARVDEKSYNKAIDECIRLIEETPWKDTNMLVESIRELKGGAIDG